MQYVTAFQKLLFEVRPTLFLPRQSLKLLGGGHCKGFGVKIATGGGGGTISLELLKSEIKNQASISQLQVG